MSGSRKTVILPEAGKKNILITSALPYVNNVPHLGNIIGSVLSADTFARYYKARPDCNTLYICGTDEYGTATETAALSAGITCQELCDKYHKIHSEVYEWFEIEFDHFGRTPTRQQTDIAQQIFLKLQENGYLEERSTDQPYCEKHNSFLADRFVEGECPLCGYIDARGDQCDKCGNLLDPLQLINPRCKLDGATPVKRETKHIFLLLDKLEAEIKDWSRKASKEGKWSANGISITESWLDKGLNPRGITRDLKWGTPVPLTDYEKKVLYVWFDACIGYVSITANYTDQWEKWWKDPENVQLYQFMGKDNVPFHTVVFPGTQIGTGEKWTQLHHLSTTEYLNYENGKFSKSRGVGVFGDGAKETGLPPDIFRYYLLSHRPETSDTDFEWQALVDCSNNELKNNLGNFCNRVIIFTTKNYASTLPPTSPYTSPDLTAWHEEVSTLLTDYHTSFTAVKLKSALAYAMRLAALGNKLLQSHTLDNKTLSAEPEKVAKVVGLALNLVHLLASVIRPFMPATSDSIFRQLGIDAGAAGAIEIPGTWSGEALGPGHGIGGAEKLFLPVGNEKAEEWREAYGGVEAKRLREEVKAKAAKRKADKERKKLAKAADKEGKAGKDGDKVGVETAEKEGVVGPEGVDEGPNVHEITGAVGTVKLQTS